MFTWFFVTTLFHGFLATSGACAAYMDDNFPPRDWDEPVRICCVAAIFLMWVFLPSLFCIAIAEQFECVDDDTMLSVQGLVVSLAAIWQLWTGILAKEIKDGEFETNRLYDLLRVNDDPDAPVFWILKLSALSSVGCLVGWAVYALYGFILIIVCIVGLILLFLYMYAMREDQKLAQEEEDESGVNRYSNPINVDDIEQPTPWWESDNGMNEEELRMARERDRFEGAQEMYGKKNKRPDNYLKYCGCVNAPVKTGLSSNCRDAIEKCRAEHACGICGDISCQDSCGEASAVFAAYTAAYPVAPGWKPLYKQMNEALVDDDEQQLKQEYGGYVKKMRECLKERMNLQPLPETVWRGMNIPADVLETYRPGEKFLWPQFTSTSKEKSIAECFTQEGDNSPVLFEIDLNGEGQTYALDIERFSIFNEKEVLIYPYSGFEVTNVITDYPYFGVNYTLVEMRTYDTLLIEQDIGQAAIGMDFDPDMDHRLDIENPEINSYMMEIFQQADEDNNGYLDHCEFRDAVALLTAGFGFGHDVIEQIMEQADENNDGVIQYREFVPVALELLRVRLDGEELE
eukprot:COSAG05_NODE_1919_length_3833_cov_3.495179_1_plen_572_part_00